MRWSPSRCNQVRTCRAEKSLDKQTQLCFFKYNMSQFPSYLEDGKRWLGWIIDVLLKAISQPITARAAQFPRGPVCCQPKTSAFLNFCVTLPTTYGNRGGAWGLTGPLIPMWIMGFISHTVHVFQAKIRKQFSILGLLWIITQQHSVMHLHYCFIDSCFKCGHCNICNTSIKGRRKVSLCLRVRRAITV